MQNNELEESLIGLRETIPRIWWNLYQGCITTGFDQSQSFSLVQTYVMGQAAGKITPGNAGGPETDIPEE